MPRRHVLSLVCLALSALSALPAARAQQPGPQPQSHLGMSNREHDHSENREQHGGGGTSAMLGLPPGIWWNNPGTVARLALTADQQKRMDDIFRQNRMQLIDIKASLEKAQLNIEPLLNAPTLDQPRLLGEISKIADLRAGLEKVDAKMLIELRGVLTAEQWTKMHTFQPRSGMGPEGRTNRGDNGPSGRRGVPPVPPVPPPPPAKADLQDLP